MSPQCPETLALNHDTLTRAFAQTPLFDSKTWQLSPEPFPLSPGQKEMLQAIGEACLAFYKAQELLYQRSTHNKSLLRNQELKAPWVAELLNAGKPTKLCQHSLHKRLKGTHPQVIRPDILITDSGFALTELDAVPGGIGLTAFLQELYTLQDQASPTMLEAFYQALKATCPKNDNPFIAIVVSEEGSDYRPEFEWLSEQLCALDKTITCICPEQLQAKPDGLYTQYEGAEQRIDLIYRFFELFDLENVSTARTIMDAVESGIVQVTPPMRPFQEEKLFLALFHHPRLSPFWQETLSSKHYKLLKQIIPNSWLLDPSPLPHSAFLNGPQLNGLPLHDWNQLAHASQKDRNLIIKASGFHETAWGSRSVTLGADVAQQEWQQKLEAALNAFPETPYILQDFHKPKQLTHPIYQPDKTVQEANVRVRLCPYYFILDGQATHAGTLATLCPADKKIIHGMKDAALLPCA